MCDCVLQSIAISFHFTDSKCSNQSISMLYRMYTFYGQTCRMYTFYGRIVECIHSTVDAIECIHSTACDHGMYTFYTLFYRMCTFYISICGIIIIIIITLFFI